MAEQSFDDNPVALELRTLRASIARFQKDAHASAVKFQRHSFDSARLHERAVHLERENDQLKAEVALLRATPSPDNRSAEFDAQSQVQDLTLALRRLSLKLSATEEALLAKTTELIHVQAETVKAKAALEGAYELGAKVRGREEVVLVRERHLQETIMRLEEDAHIADVALQEYAALVREMEITKSLEKDSSAGVIEGVDEGARISATLLEGKLMRSRLHEQFEAETSKIEAALLETKNELEVTKSHLEAERKGTAVLVHELGKAKTELEKLNLEDGSAAKMVSRYMQFSQMSTNALISKLSALKARHAGTLGTLSSQNHSLAERLRASEAHGQRLLDTLDELGGEIMRETWGRRREVGLRIRMGGREERITEGLRRWVRRSDEVISRTRGDGLSDPQEAGTILDALLSIAQDARILLASLDEGVLDEEIALSLSGTRARALLVNIGLEGLLEELKEENEKRINLENRLVATRNYSMLNGRVSGDSPRRSSTANGNSQSNTPHGSISGEEESERPLVVPQKSHASLEEATLGGSLLYATETTAHAPANLENPALRPEIMEESLPKDRSSDTQISQSETASLSSGPEEVKSSLLLSDEEAEVVTENEVDVTLEVDSTVKDTIVLSTVNLAIEDPHPPSNLVTPASTPARVEKAATDIEASEATTPNQPSLSLPDTISGNVNALTSAGNASRNTLPSPTPPLTNDVSGITHTMATNSPFASALGSTKSPTPQHPHSFLNELIHVTKRYDDLQRSFRDCHIALESLRAGLTEHSASTDSLQGSIISEGVLRAALRRLDDYTEDARVELEIRISDEALLAKGYEALLSVPGALSTTSLKSPEDNHEVPTQSEVEQQVSEFVQGTDIAVRRARETFTRKLEDVQHDIAALKRAIHDPESFAPPSLSLPASAAEPASLNGELSDNAVGSVPSPGGWTSWVRNASRPASPAPPSHGPAPTFGNIMTAPRLRHSPSSGNMKSTPLQPPSARSRRPSFFGLGGGPIEPNPSPLAALQLRVPMPSFIPASTKLPLSPESTSVFGGAFGVLSPTSPLTPMSMGPGSRARTVSSTMYMLGLGSAGSPSGNWRLSRSASATVGLTPSSHSSGNRQTALVQELPVLPRTKDAEDEDEDEDENEDEYTEDEADTDVE